VNHFLFAHGDSQQPLESTRRVLDEIVTDFITELCFEAARSASQAGRQKIKVDDIKFACRKNPQFLGKIEEVFTKKSDIDKIRKTFDEHDTIITKGGKVAGAVLGSGVEEEPLGAADDDVDMDLGGKNISSGAGK
jgi:transcription initiation factor TFIID subunit 13